MDLHAINDEIEAGIGTYADMEWNAPRQGMPDLYVPVRGLDLSDEDRVRVGSQVRQMVGVDPDEHERAQLEAAKTNARAQTAVPLRLCLQVRFFGRFEILCDDAVVPLGHNAKALTILRYLLTRPEKQVSRDHLMGWLWPESNAKRASSSLNSAIHALRKLLVGLSSPATTPAGYVLFEEGYYRLSPNVRVSSDAAEFDARYKRGRNLDKGRRMPEAAAEYEKAIDLYRGDYLVEDLYEEWTLIERERLATAYTDMLNRIAGYYAATGLYQESIQTCYRLLEKDPCHEDSHRLVMECYARLGLRARASRHYQLCQYILRRKVGLDPSLEIKALHRRILSSSAINSG